MLAAHRAARSQAAQLCDGHRRAGARAGEAGRGRDRQAAAIAARCTACRSRSRTCASPRASAPRAARRILCRLEARDRCHRGRAAARRGRGAARQAADDRGRLRRPPSRGRSGRSIPGTPTTGRAPRRPARASRPRPGSATARSAPIPAARSASRRPATASPASSRPGAGSAATASFRCRTRSITSGRWPAAPPMRRPSSRAIAGPDDNDPTTLTAPVPDYLAGLDEGVLGARGLRIGIDPASTARASRPRWSS